VTADRSLDAANEVRRQAWAKEAPKYDKRIGFFEKRVFGPEHRTWACSKATGDTLEVAVGTGLNLDLYPPEVKVTGLDLSPEMLAIARARAAALGREAELREGDAHSLPFEAETFDSVICTYSLCNIPDPRLAVAEMKRVLRPGGRLILVDHIKGASKPVLWVQKMLEFFSRREGEFMTRRSLEHVEAEGFSVSERQRFGPGAMVERILAIK
jgi:ubiquinone/menaquinone biosynthesis C-methylase UbiE